MKKHILQILFLATLLTTAPAQDLRFQVDSLKRELLQAKHDTTRIRLRYYLGHKASISRIGYWDSLVSDAHAQKAHLFESRALNTLGFQCRIQNKGEKALESLNRSYEIARKTGNRAGMIAPLLNFSSYYLLKNDVKKSFSYCFRALRIAEELKDKSKMALIYAELGLCYFSASEFNKALTMHLKSLKITEELKDKKRIVQNLMAIGTDYLWLKQFDKMLSYYLACKHYSDAFGESVMAVEINNSIASAYNHVHEYDSAYKYSTKACRISLRTDSKLARVSAISMLAAVNYEKGDLRNAEKLAREALNISKEMNYILQMPVLTDVLKKLYIKQHDYRSALEAYEAHVAATDSLSREKIRKDALEKEFDYNLEKKENENKLLAQQNTIQAIELRQNRYLVLSMGLLLLFVFLVSYLVARQNKLKAEQQRSRLEQKLLRSQMNPHFIFNSLQAVQNFILKRDEKEAVRYLGAFASITRQVLENSRTELIPLKKEIDLLDQYLQLQKLRFKNRFDYKIELDETIDPENMAIPPMLAQPFVENSVEHGFHGITGGLIRVSYRMDHNELLLEITDNGAGIKNDPSSPRQHRSMALEITRERVALMNKKAKEKVTFTLGAAFPHLTERKGVCARFRLPLNLLIYRKTDEAGI